MKKEYDFKGAKRGPLIRNKGKTRITIYIDDDVINYYRDRADQEGKGYQTMINNVLRTSISLSKERISKDDIRSIFREELDKCLGNMQLKQIRLTNDKSPEISSSGNFLANVDLRNDPRSIN